MLPPLSQRRLPDVRECARNYSRRLSTPRLPSPPRGSLLILQLPSHPAAAGMKDKGHLFLTQHIVIGPLLCTDFNRSEVYHKMP